MHVCEPCEVCTLPTIGESMAAYLQEVPRASEIAQHIVDAIEHLESDGGGFGLRAELLERLAQ